MDTYHRLYEGSYVTPVSITAISRLSSIYSVIFFLYWCDPAFELKIHHRAPTQLLLQQEYKIIEIFLYLEVSLSDAPVATKTGFGGSQSLKKF